MIAECRFLMSRYTHVFPRAKVERKTRKFISSWFHFVCASTVAAFEISGENKCVRAAAQSSQDT